MERMRGKGSQMNEKELKKLDIKRLLVNQKFSLNYLEELLTDSNFDRNEVYKALQDVIIINQIIRKKVNSEK